MSVMIGMGRRNCRLRIDIAIRSIVNQQHGPMPPVLRLSAVSSRKNKKGHPRSQHMLAWQWHAQLSVRCNTNSTSSCKLCNRAAAVQKADKSGELLYSHAIDAVEREVL
eukprot:2497611-Pleurochrysis_carterae.AAC.1